MKSSTLKKNNAKVFNSKKGKPLQVISTSPVLRVRTVKGKING